MYGVNGKILHVDLSNEKIWVEKYNSEDLKKLIGSRGLQAKLLWEYTSPNTDPLSPENVIMFGAGTLTGTIVPASGRTTVTFKSPATKMYFKCSVGGQFGIRLKLSGYDILVIHGKAEKPVYLYIDSHNVDIKDASGLWGKDVKETYAELMRKYRNKSNANLIDIATIGPAGERLVKFASIMCSIYNAAARGGGGAVLGSKNLKAIVAVGAGEVEVADPKKLYDLSLKIRNALSTDAAALATAYYGTLGSVNVINYRYHAFPSYNFKSGYFGSAYKLSGKYVVEKGYLVGRVGCGACPISCHRHTKTKKYNLETVGPEYETVNALGAGVGVSDTDDVILANELCNIYGLDTISTGGVIQWAMECYEKGILKSKDVDNLDLTWGNGRAVIELIKKIAYREGFGDILAEGVKEAASKIGGETWKWAVQSRGLEQSRIDVRGARAYALAFAVNPRGPDHLHTETMAEFGLTPEAKELIKRITGDEKYAVPFTNEKRAEIVRWHEDVFAITDSLGLCAFTTTASYVITPELMAELFTAVTGIEMNKEELMTAGRRILNIERLYNLREGHRGREDDTLPWRAMNEPLPSGPAKGSFVSKEELDTLLDQYYKLHEWDTNGVPKEKTLRKLGLEKFLKF